MHKCVKNTALSFLIATSLVSASSPTMQGGVDAPGMITPEGAGETPASDPANMAGPEPLQAASASKKKILDLVRKGVVVVDVKTYASTDIDKKTSWTGSGFLVHRNEADDSAIIATNHHVAGDMTVSSHKVKFSNGTTANAQLLYFDPLFDFAFLKVKNSKLPKDAVVLELSDKPMDVNQVIYTMGNSARDEFSTYECTVFSLYENLGPFAEQSVRFSGLTIPGVSGSPGFDESGKVVLIVYGGKMTSGAGLPIAYIRDALEHLKKGTTPPRRSIGIVPEYGSLESFQKAGLISESAVVEYIKAFPEANNKILMINSKLIDTQANTAFKAGDILWKVNGTLVGPALYAIDKIINATQDNQDITVEVYRQGKLETVTIKSYAIDIKPTQNMIVFADATWVGANEFTRFFLGRGMEGVFMMGVGRTSPFQDLVSQENMWAFMDPTRFTQVTELDGKPIKTLNDLWAVVPTLMQKHHFTMKYIDYAGMMGLGTFISSDRQERMAVVGYESKFDSPKFYTFNTNTLEWDTQDVDKSGFKNPTKSAYLTPAQATNNESTTPPVTTQTGC